MFGGGGAGCQGRKRCDNNPHDHPLCPKAAVGTPLVHPLRPASAAAAAAAAAGLSPPPPFSPGEEKCSVPADSPLTAMNETSLVNRSIGWKGCNDYSGWAQILGRLAKQYPQLTALNIDDFSANVPSVFSPASVAAIRAGLAVGHVKLIPTHYHGGAAKFIWRDQPWLPAAVDGALFYFRCV